MLKQINVIHSIIPWLSFLTLLSDCLYHRVLHMCRSFLSATGGPAQWPDASRLVEAICVRLCELHPSPTKSTKSKTGRVREQRWSTILAKYSHLRELVLSNRQLLDNTTLQLFELNQRTLTQWFVASPHSFQSSYNNLSSVQL